MARSNNSKIKTIPMKVGNDPAIWRFGSLQQALEVTNELISEAIQTGKEQSIIGESKDEIPVVAPISAEPKAPN